MCVITFKWNDFDSLFQNNEVDFLYQDTKGYHENLHGEL